MARIAIIGTGISGMGTAYMLKRAGHQIAVYEQAPVSGGHTRTLRIDYDGTSVAVDTGFIVFNVPNYPHLTAMFAHLGVPTHASNMSFAITLDEGAFEWGARSLGAVFAQRRNLLRPSFYRLVRDVLRFNAKAVATVEAHPDASLGEMIAHLRLGEGFLKHYLLPMGGAIWSCPPKQMLDFPARTFVQFFKNHGLLSINGQHQWYTVSGGSHVYKEKLTASFEDAIRLDCAVTGVRRHATGVEVTDSRGHTESFDRVVFACHADQALAILGEGASTQERAVLGAFHYQRNVAILHRDASLMPKRRAAWASWVYHATEAEAGREAHIGVTYWMNLLQSIDEKKPLFVTLNPARAIPESLVFNRHVFEHPVFTREAIAAQALLPSLQGQQHSWFCGAYTRYGFHEDGLLSAVSVAESMGVPIPWS